MPLPFIRRELRRQGLFRKLLGRPLPANAIIEIGNLLATVDSIRSIPAEQIKQLAQKHRAPFPTQFHSETESFVRRYLEHCFSKGVPSDDEFEEARYLSKLVGVDPEKYEDIRRENARKTLKKEIQAVVALASPAKECLAVIAPTRERLWLGEEDATEVYNEAATEYVHDLLTKAVADQRVSPEEDSHIADVAARLGVNVTYDDQTKSIMERFRLLWQIENGEVPSIAPDINLQRGEICYLKRLAQWLESKTVTKRIGYSGPTARIKIMKGLYWRVGDLGVRYTKEEVMTLIDRGTLYLTNKRLVFVGLHKTTSIRLNKILDFKPYKNGLEVVKDAGKTPFLKFDEDTEVFAATLARALRDV